MAKGLSRILLAASLAIAGTAGSASLAFAQAEPFLGQLILFAGNFCPRGWAPASGQLLPINQNQALFAILGTTYGGNGQTTFALPDLRGRAPIHEGQGSGLLAYSLGQRAGAESFSLLLSQLPPHNHTVQATNSVADKGGPNARYFAAIGTFAYHDGPANKVMASDMITPTGGNQPVSHREPYLTMTWCIALQGIFPSRT